MAIAQIFALLVSAKVDSMGGIVDCGVGVDLKASPLRAAIEKAQSELRQEYDVREERRRELEFLENGGNPLDFKIGHTASISVQSTSLTDQLAEQYVTSEAKGSFALAASPHGDSVESSGRPGGSLGRESNIADNLLLFDGGGNSNADGARNAKRTCKRGNTSSLEQSDGFRNVKKQSDGFHIGIRNQAYARRNRSRSSRDSTTHVASSDLIPGHSNKPLLLPSLRPDSKDAKPVDHAVSSISNSKPASPKNLASDDQVDMRLDLVDVISSGVPEGETKIKTSDDLQENDPNSQQSHVATEKVANGTTALSSDFLGKNEAVSGSFISEPLGPAENTKDITSAERVNVFSAPDKDVTDLQDEIVGTKDTKTDPSRVNTSSSIAGNADGDQCSMLKRADGGPDGDSKEHSTSRGIVSTPDINDLGEKSRSIAVDGHIVTNDESRYVRPNPNNSSIQIKDEVELCNIMTDLQSEVISLNNTESVNLNHGITLKLERIQDNSFGDSSNSINKVGMITSALVVSSCEPANATLSKRGSTTAELQNSTATRVKLAKKAHEDAILKEARVIEANLRRAGGPSMSSITSEKRKKCHWDFVLEEMSWMANDFMQERVWKTTAAAQVCHRIASSGKVKFEEENTRRRQKSIAKTLAKAIMHFWQSAEVFRNSGQEPIDIHNSDLFKSWKVNRADAKKGQDSNYEEAEKSIKILQPAVLDYAIRFLNYVSHVSTQPILAEAPTTPDRINDTGIIGMSWEDQQSDESLFYIVPPGAMQAYRESVESQWAHTKKTGNSFHEEDCETSMCDSVADGPREIIYEEDEGETGTYFLSGAFDGSLSSKFAHKKRKNLEQKSYAAARLYEVGSDMSYEHCVEAKSGNQSLIFTGKRPSSTPSAGSVPTKRVRTASRQRVLSPFSAGVTGSLQVTSKTDVSSGDTNSFQDDQSSLHAGSQPRKKMEVESTADFGRQLPHDGFEISSKSKKKKKPKHMGYKSSFDPTDCGVSGKASMYEQRLQLDSIIQHEQRNHVKKRLESQHFDSNGNNGHYGQHAIKKPKLLKHLSETSPEAFTPTTGSMPSPVASQMSNMSSPNKLIKLIANRDRGRKNKTMKLIPGQPGSGSLWSNFEDQALVVLVHDMGTNWELVSDAINSTLQFKCIFRKPSECKDRHKFLMDRNTGDGADSAEDSGSSQPYPSTLPGIPKGSARQLFQRLQGPMEEDTLKSHFEKIISIGQKLLTCRSQNDIQEPKQISTAHSSHAVALSHVCPTNFTGGVLTPLDHCDSITLSPEALTLGYQGSHTSGLAIPSHQSSVTSVLPTSSASIMLQGSPSMVLGNSLSSPSTPLNAPARDAQRYSMPRPTSLPADDQQRMQQYGPLPSGRNIPHSSMPVPMGVDPGVRMLPGGNGMGMMRGGNRGMPMSRPCFQAASPPGMRNIVSPGNMRSGRGVGMPNNIHPSAVSSPGNSMLRSRATMQMLQNPEEHNRQLMMQELHLQGSQGNGQSVVSFNGMSAPFSNGTVSPPVQTFPVQQYHQQPHQMPQQPHMHVNPHHPPIQATNHPSPQQDAYALRFAERQQRIMPQSQHPFSGSNAMSPIQNNYQIQQQTQSSTPGTPIPSSQVRHKQQEMPHNPQAGNGMPNPVMKQRQCQQVQHQQPRLQQQQQQRQQSQQAKLTKGLGRGAMLMHQNLSADGLSMASKNQVPEKHLMQQSQGFFPGSSVLNPTQGPQPSSQPKMFSRPFPQSSKQMPPMPSHSDNPNQVSPSHTLLAPQQPSAPSSLPLSSQQQQMRQTNQSQQNMQRITLQQNCQMSSEGRIQSSTDQVQVNQMIPTTSLPPQCTDSSTPVASSAIQWKPEPSYDASKPAPTAHLASFSQENLVGSETLMHNSSQGLAQRQFSGSVPLHKHGIGGQWEKQQQPQQQQPQHQHRQAAQQGNLYVLPSNSGPG